MAKIIAPIAIRGTIIMLISDQLMLGPACPPDWFWEILIPGIGVGVGVTVDAGEAVDVGVGELVGVGVGIKVKAPLPVAVPPGVVTETGPVAPLPTTAVIEVSELTKYEAAAVPPKLTAVTADDDPPP